MLVVPMRTPQGETIGALQLINCKPDARRGASPPPTTSRGDVRPFDERHERLAGSLASQAGIALENAPLYDEIQRALRGLRARRPSPRSSRATRRPPATRRAWPISPSGSPSAVDRAGAGRTATLRFTADDLHEIEYAALLHDFGKVGVREQVLVKAKKLYPHELDAASAQRFDLLQRDLEVERHRAASSTGRRGAASRAASSEAAKLRHRPAPPSPSSTRRSTSSLAANEPTVLGRAASSAARRDRRARVPGRRRAAGDRSSPTTRSRRSPITRGSLTERERREIEQHVVHTYNFLAQIPWSRDAAAHPRDRGRAPREARRHAATRAASPAAQIPVQSRMMTIADIYDALTATDRPYKKAVPVENALDTLRDEQKAGALDGALLDLFIDARVFERTD